MSKQLSCPYYVVDLMSCLDGRPRYYDGFHREVLSLASGIILPNAENDRKDRWRNLFRDRYGDSFDPLLFVDDVAENLSVVSFDEVDVVVERFGGRSIRAVGIEFGGRDSMRSLNEERKRKVSLLFSTMSEEDAALHLSRSDFRFFLDSRVAYLPFEDFQREWSSAEIPTEHDMLFLLCHDDEKAAESLLARSFFSLDGGEVLARPCSYFQSLRMSDLVNLLSRKRGCIAHLNDVPLALALSVAAREARTQFRICSSARPSPVDFIELGVEYPFVPVPLKKLKLFGKWLGRWICQGDHFSLDYQNPTFKESRIFELRSRLGGIVRKSGINRIVDARLSAGAKPLPPIIASDVVFSAHWLESHFGSSLSVELIEKCLGPLLSSGGFAVRSLMTEILSFELSRESNTEWRRFEGRVRESGFFLEWGEVFGDAVDLSQSRFGPVRYWRVLDFGRGLLLKGAQAANDGLNNVESMKSSLARVFVHLCEREPSLRGFYFVLKLKNLRGDDPSSISREALGELAYLNERLGDKRKALELYTGADGPIGNRLFYQRRRIGLLTEQGKLGHALEVLEALKCESEEFTQLGTEVGVELSARGDFESSLVFFETAPSWGCMSKAALNSLMACIGGQVSVSKIEDCLVRLNQEVGVSGIDLTPTMDAFYRCRVNEIHRLVCDDRLQSIWRRFSGLMRSSLKSRPRTPAIRNYELRFAASLGEYERVDQCIETMALDVSPISPEITASLCYSLRGDRVRARTMLENDADRALGSVQESLLYAVGCVLCGWIEKAGHCYESLVVESELWGFSKAQALGAVAWQALALKAFGSNDFLDEALRRLKEVPNFRGYAKLVDCFEPSRVNGSDSLVQSMRKTMELVLRKV